MLDMVTHLETELPLGNTQSLNYAKVGEKVDGEAQFQSGKMLLICIPSFS